MPPFYMQLSFKSKIGWTPSGDAIFFGLSRETSSSKKSRQPFQVGGFFSWGLKRLLLARRQVRATPVRHLRRHADAFAQRGVWVDRFADAHGVGAHVNVKKVLFKVH